MDYRCEATSLEGFVQQLASNILPHGYWFWVGGYVPDGKDPRAIDAKLIEKYGVDLSRQQRARRKLVGHANVHYLRYGRHWVLLATKGEHPFFAEEADNIRDARKSPIAIEGYSLSVKQGGFLRKDDADGEPVADGKRRVRVQIARERFKDLRADLLSVACRRSAEELSKLLYSVPFEPYAPVRRQMLNILRLVNEQRGEAGLSKLPTTVLRYKRQIVKPFEVIDRGEWLPQGSTEDARSAMSV
ncbi:hypothetical protein Pan44_08010 [Caulifigura coniformis]|uniref:Uncharacterized protein n=1 Tax=Caulifigura coniformis TaxID=2527983 RepID=A0A517S9I3_9PLAN|nr:hypothetical protein [Caulifigura coniformis]QDT52789.1 hypothetical protein Pan44_08010 [Caulifigura coniformis]